MFTPEELLKVAKRHKNRSHTLKVPIQGDALMLLTFYAAERKMKVEDAAAEILRMKAFGRVEGRFQKGKSDESSVAKFFGDC